MTPQLNNASLHGRRLQSADNAFQDFDFHIEVSDTDRWDTSDAEDFHRVVYGENGGRYTFHVRFSTGTETPSDVYALDLSTGAHVGAMNPPTIDSPLPVGWQEGESGIATNPDPISGGIIDTNIVSGKWFVIFNRVDLAPIEELDTRQQAFEAFANSINVAPGKVATRSMPLDSPLQQALYALCLASTNGGELDRPFYLECKQQLQQMVDQVLKHDLRLELAERPPLGDDYNDLRTLLGM